jgi:hypothetical protein
VSLTFDQTKAEGWGSPIKATASGFHAQRYFDGLPESRAQVFKCNRYSADLLIVEDVVVPQPDEDDIVLGWDEPEGEI